MRTTILAITLTFSSALAASPQYSVHDYDVHGRVTIRIANIGVVPNGDAADCQRLLAGFQRGQAKYPDGVVTKTRISTCDSSLPFEFVGIEQGTPLVGAFVVKVQPANTGAVYTAWFGLEATKAVSTCERLLSEMRTRMSATVVASVQLTCVPPKKS